MRIRILLLTLVLCACARTPYNAGTSHHTILFSPAMDRDMGYTVYTPPGWSPREQLPLLVMLHGANDDETTFFRYGVDKYLDGEIAAKRLPRVIVLNPQGDRGFWENWYDGSRSYRDWVLNDLMPVVQTQYNTLPCPASCFVSGVSMGAHGAMRFGYYAPDTFASVAAISGRIVSREQATDGSLKMAIMRFMLPVNRIWGDLDKLPRDGDPYVAWTENRVLSSKPLMLAWGEQEDADIVDSNLAFKAHLSANQRPYTQVVFNGEHRWVDWAPVIAESIRFHLANGERK
ncbi:alpha/beta hydrolase [Teredinibacter turnerae]|uniref:alpha/beta hydrolase n=1 Tax=Teredinibacter turnerae TaxID=2426 RepID=UPI001E4BBD09|nr:alpha/beta hydrolase-fold protein [Teredinibacter turnerae]